eukprot:3333339-Pyramimonas_sp.AAC.1
MRPTCPTDRPLSGAVGSWGASVLGGQHGGGKGRGPQGSLSVSATTPSVHMGNISFAFSCPVPP